jgi:hypothetical protein
MAIVKCCFLERLELLSMKRCEEESYNYSTEFIRQWTEYTNNYQFTNKLFRLIASVFPNPHLAEFTPTVRTILFDMYS